MTFKIDFSNLDNKLANVLQAVEKDARKVILETAAQAVGIIADRTREKGEDKDGHKFKPYSDGYLKQRKRDGIRTGSRVTLTSSGKVAKGGIKNKKGARKASPLRGNAQGGQMINHIDIVRVERGGVKAVISLSSRLELEKMERHIRGSGNLPIRNPLGFTKPEDKRLRTTAASKIKAAIQKQGRK